MKDYETPKGWSLVNRYIGKDGCYRSVYKRKDCERTITIRHQNSGVKHPNTKQTWSGR